MNNWSVSPIWGFRRQQAMTTGGDGDTSKQELFHLIKRFGACVTFKISNLFSLSLHGLVFLFSLHSFLALIAILLLFFNFFLIGPSFGWIWFDIKILSFCWLSLAQFVIICCCFLFLMFSLFVWSFDLSAFFAPLSLNEWLWSGIV